MASTALEFLRNLKSTKAVEELFDAKFGTSDAENAGLIQHGFWHVRYFAQARSWAGEDSSWLGVRILPNKPLAEMPVVATNKFGAITISPTLKDFVPNWLLYMRIESGDWNYIHTEWEKVEDQIQNIHSRLGGDPNFFDRFKSYVLNDENFQTKDYLDRKSRAYDFLKVDQSTETIQFREFIQRLILDETLLPEFSGDFGAWNDYARAAIATRAYFLRGNKTKSLLDTVQSMWLGFDKSAPFDSDIFGKIKQFTLARDPTLSLHSIALSTTQPYTHLNEPAIPDSIRNDPLFPAALALGSLDHAGAYQGVEHMEAAAKLDVDFNDGQRSYEALISASFWSAMNIGFPFKESYQAALHLAAKYGWDEMRELLEINEFKIQ